MHLSMYYRVICPSPLDLWRLPSPLNLTSNPKPQGIPGTTVALGLQYLWVVLRFEFGCSNPDLCEAVLVFSWSRVTVCRVAQWRP